MPLLRRLTALLSACLLLQLTLLGADWGCGTRVASADRAHGATPLASHASHDASSTHAPTDACDVERALGDCATMTSCATTLTFPASLVVAVALAPTSDALPEPASIHSQPAAGPDVPPPRG
jgi:hypothetical protein